ncbi:sigma-70 family RNA polymerase sigma factor [Ruminiclostridium josui]|uniref:sigma-70 family RNA polymerase sigma factor n=1 Tax=Ruminiclostridium josui TaxID=1499 RepID=UPI0006CF9D07|nr:sigma-70 family RNA polymerase sigma factor [Ruminiclostridium josui]
MTNEELAIRIKAGECELLPELWEQVKYLLFFILRRMFFGSTTYQERAASTGVTLEDLEQECYFALLNAIGAYDPDTGFTFSTYCRLSIKSQMQKALKIRITKTRVWQSGDALNRAESIDAPRGEDGDIDLADMLADPGSLLPYEEVEDDLERQRLHELLETCLRELKDVEEQVIRSRYYKDMTMEAVAAERSLSSGRIRQIETKALRMLARDSRLQAERRDIIDQYAYHGNLTRFKNSGSSSVEITVEKLIMAEKKDRRSRAAGQDEKQMGRLVGWGIMGRKKAGPTARQFSAMQLSQIIPQ